MLSPELDPGWRERRPYAFTIMFFHREPSNEIFKAIYSKTILYYVAYIHKYLVKKMV